MIKAMIENLGLQDLEEEEALPLTQIKSDILEMVIKFATHHKNTQLEEEGESRRQMTEWDKEFFKVDLRTLLELIRVANYLDMEDLLDYAAEAVSKAFAGKSPDVITETSISADPNQPEDSPPLKPSRRRSSSTFSSSD
ncbi:S-phase kinase-associated protein 1-like isoform X2 [Trichogramma pretiosum]|nr:S-phase kinase-associated protein 1-like isoform X2 [Trichogramma pretiosum]